MRGCSIHSGSAWILSQLAMRSAMSTGRAGRILSSPYAMFIAALAHQRVKAPDKATEILEGIRAHVEPASWQASIVAFLEGKMSADALAGQGFARSAADRGARLHRHQGQHRRRPGGGAEAPGVGEGQGPSRLQRYRLALGELDRIERAEKAAK